MKLLEEKKIKILCIGFNFILLERKEKKTSLLKFSGFDVGEKGEDEEQICVLFYFILCFFLK